MKIALINENSQASKNEIIYNTLKEVTDKYNYELYNYGMCSESDPNLTYVQAGLLASILLTTKKVDFVITGCGTGSGAMLACNTFPNVFCGLIVDPTDAYLFSQINAGNAISIPYAKGFGWGSELTLKNIFENLFKEKIGGGYPKERAIPERENRELLAQIKNVTTQDLLSILKQLDKDFIKNTINRQNFIEEFFKEKSTDDITKYLENILKN